MCVFQGCMFSVSDGGPGGMSVMRGETVAELTASFVFDGRVKMPAAILGVARGRQGEGNT